MKRLVKQLELAKEVAELRDAVGEEANKVARDFKTRLEAEFEVRDNKMPVKKTVYLCVAVAVFAFTIGVMV